LTIRREGIQNERGQTLERLAVLFTPTMEVSMQRHSMNGSHAPQDDYAAFLAKKSQLGGLSGFEPLWMPDFLFDFQSFLDVWAIRKGRSAVYADCGLGKSVIAFVWAENVVRHTNKPVLVLTPIVPVAAARVNIALLSALNAATFRLAMHRTYRTRAGRTAKLNVYTDLPWRSASVFSLPLRF
jgi:hypothetical protein